MTSNSAGIIVVGAILIGLLLFGGTIWATLQNALNGSGGNFISDTIAHVTELIQRFLNPNATGGGDSATGMASIAFRVYFTDGTTQEINQDMSYSILPYSITFGSKTMTKLDVDILGKFTGANIGAWNTKTSIHTALYKKPETVPKTSATGNFTTGGTSWASGTIKTLQSYTVQAGELDTIVATYGNGGYLLQVTGTLDININVNGHAQTYTASPLAGGVDFTYSNGQPTGLSITSIPKSLR